MLIITWKFIGGKSTGAITSTVAEGFPVTSLDEAEGLLMNEASTPVQIKGRTPLDASVPEIQFRAAPLAGSAHKHKNNVISAFTLSILSLEVKRSTWAALRGRNILLTPHAKMRNICGAVKKGSACETDASHEIAPGNLHSGMLLSEKR